MTKNMLHVMHFTLKALFYADYHDEHFSNILASLICHFFFQAAGLLSEPTYASSNIAGHVDDTYLAHCKLHSGVVANRFSHIFCEAHEDWKKTLMSAQKDYRTNQLANGIRRIGIEFAATPELLSDRQVVRKRRKAFLTHHVSHLKKKENIRKGWSLTKPLPPSQVC